MDLSQPGILEQAFGHNAFDIVLCNDALMHNPQKGIARILQNFNPIGRYLIANSYVEAGDNTDIALGGWRRLDLTTAPYAFEPICGDLNHHAAEIRDPGEYIVVFELPLP